MLARYEYDVFGAIRSETGTSDNTRKFTGKEWDADSHLYYFAARYYDPYIGRFTQRDPAGDGLPTKLTVRAPRRNLNIKVRYNTHGG